MGHYLTHKPDRRRKGVKELMDSASTQMYEYFMQRYSFGQTPAQDRLDDWAWAMGIIETHIQKHGYVDLEAQFLLTIKFPSGQEGTIRSLVSNYHDGEALVRDHFGDLWEDDCA